MTALASIIVTLFYALAGWSEWRSNRSIGVRRWLPAVLLLHGALLYHGIVHGGSLHLGITEALSLLGWESALLLWAFCLNERLDLLGVVNYPAAGLTCLLAAVLPTRSNPVPLDDWKIGLHIAFSLLSAGILTVAALQAGATAILDQMLHRPGKLTLLQRLPPLQTMERLLFQQIAVGFSLLTLTILSGILFVHNLFAEHLAEKTLLTCCAWLIFGILLWGRYRHGWRGRVAVRWALSGYVTLVMAYFGSKLLVEQMLGTHWT